MKKLIPWLLTIALLLAIPANAAITDNLATSSTINQQTILGQSHGIFQNMSMWQRGANLGVMVATVTESATDSSGSTYRAFVGLDPKIVPVQVLVAGPANVSATSRSVGLYTSTVVGGGPYSNAGVYSTGGAAKAAACFASAQNWSAGAASLNPKTAFDGMVSTTLANYGNALWQFAGDSSAANAPAGGYDLTITTGSASSGGTWTVLLVYAIPQSAP